MTRTGSVVRGILQRMDEVRETIDDAEAQERAAQARLVVAREAFQKLRVQLDAETRRAAEDPPVQIETQSPEDE